MASFGDALAALESFRTDLGDATTTFMKRSRMSRP